MPDNVEAGDSCQDHESDDDLQGMLRSPFDKELSELRRARVEQGNAQRIRLGHRPFCGHRQTPKNLFAGPTAQLNLNNAASRAGLGAISLSVSRFRRGMILFCRRCVDFQLRARLWILAVRFVQPLPYLALAEERYPEISANREGLVIGRQRQLDAVLGAVPRIENGAAFVAKPVALRVLNQPYPEDRLVLAVIGAARTDRVHRIAGLRVHFDDVSFPQSVFFFEADQTANKTAAWIDLLPNSCNRRLARICGSHKRRAQDSCRGPQALFVNLDHRRLPFPVRQVTVTLTKRCGGIAARCTRPTMEPRRSSKVKAGLQCRQTVGRTCSQICFSVAFGIAFRKAK